MDSIQPSRKLKNVVAALAIIILCAGWSVSALSATTTEVSRDTVVRDLRSIEIPVEAFSVGSADHVSIEPEPSNFDPAKFELLDVQDASRETAAPFLYLTPRVASVLRDIFDANRDVIDEPDVREISSSPVAESDRIPDISELLDESVPAIDRDNEIDLPRFQQRMFRTDI